MGALSSLSEETEDDDGYAFGVPRAEGGQTILTQRASNALHTKATGDFSEVIQMLWAEEAVLSVNGKLITRLPELKTQLVAKLHLKDHSVTVEGRKVQVNPTVLSTKKL